ncbi:MAG TPA: hypothetical protein VL361_03785 [Candidatus Limnocylindrales bacterium]|jgi:hypothetical protein|nr:hypothetical protein [Candidatus Limnocylindrales bacterium]
MFLRFFLFFSSLPGAKSALEIVLQHWYSPGVNHSGIDEISFSLARCVVERLRGRPELLEIARRNLSGWQRRNADSPSLLRCYAEWEVILTRPLEEICALLVAETEEGQRLRQNSPFAGVLSPAEVWEIKEQHRHAAASA